MTLKIEKYADEYSTTIRLIGRVQAVTTFGGTEDADRGERTKARDGLGRSGLGRRGGCSVPRDVRSTRGQAPQLLALHTRLDRQRTRLEQGSGSASMTATSINKERLCQTK